MSGKWFSLPCPLPWTPNQPGAAREAGQAVQCERWADRRAVLSGSLRNIRPPQRRGSTEHVRTIQILCGGNEIGNIWPIQSVTEVYILTSPQLDDDLTALLGQYRSRKSSSEIKRVSCSCIYIHTATLQISSF